MPVFNCFGCIPEVELLGHMVIMYFLEELQIISHSSWNVLHYHHSIWSFPFLCILPTLFIFIFEKCSLPGEVASDCGFDFHFSLMMLSNFSCACWPFVYLWKKRLCMSLAHVLIELFFILLLSCKNSLYILDSRPLSDIWLQIFLLYYRLSFHFLDSVLWCTKDFNFEEVHFIYF